MKIKTLLMERLGYSANEADMLAADLSALQPVLQPMLEQWIEKNIESDSTSFHGYSIDTLRENTQMNFIAALLSLNWVICEPEKAIPIIRSGIK